jgi:hypothetical protein
MISFAKLKRPTPPPSIEQKIRRLQSDIRALQQKDAQTYDKAVRDGYKEPLTLSGSYERLLINGKSL